MILKWTTTELLSWCLHCLLAERRMRSEPNNETRAFCSETLNQRSLKRNSSAENCVEQFHILNLFINFISCLKCSDVHVHRRSINFDVKVEWINSMYYNCLYKSPTFHWTLQLNLCIKILKSTSLGSDARWWNRWKFPLCVCTWCTKRGIQLIKTPQLANFHLSIEFTDRDTGWWISWLEAAPLKINWKVDRGGPEIYWVNTFVSVWARNIRKWRTWR